MKYGWLQNASAVLWVTIGTALFSLVYASGKFAADTVFPIQILFLRYIGGLLMLMGTVLVAKKPVNSLISKQPLSHFFRAVFGAYGGVAIIYASANMPIMDATAISLLSVIFMVFLGIIFCHETLVRRQWLAIFISVGGAVIIVFSQSAFANFGVAYIRPALIALLGAALIAAEGVLIKKLTQSDPPLSILLYVNCFGILLLLPPTLVTWKALSLPELLPYLLLGPLAVSAQYFILRGYRMADVAIVAPVDYTWLIFAALIGYWFFDELPPASVIYGSILVVIGALILATQTQNILSRKPPPPLQ